MSEVDWAVRRAGAADCRRLLELVREYWDFEGIEGYDATSVEVELSSLLSGPKLGAAWIATADGDAVGYLLLVFVFSLEHGGLTAEIDELYVRDSCRGAGIGRRLLEAAEVACRDAACFNISLQVGSRNAAAREFYLRRGFRRRSGYDLLERDLDV